MLDDLADILALAFTNSQLLIISERYINKNINSKIWLGDRIICMGDALEPNDLPENLFTPETWFYIGL